MRDVYGGQFCSEGIVSACDLLNTGLAVVHVQPAATMCMSVLVCDFAKDGLRKGCVQTGEDASEDPLHYKFFAPRALLGLDRQPARRSEEKHHERN